MCYHVYDDLYYPELSVLVRLYRTARLNSSTDAAILGALCSDAVVERLGKAVEALTQRDSSNFLRGYRLVGHRH